MIPLATTTVTVRRPTDDTQDLTDQPAYETVASMIPAAITAPAGSGTAVGGRQEQIDAQLAVDPMVLLLGDLVDDDATGDTYTVAWTFQRNGLGLDHVTAGLRKVRGAGG